MGMYTELLVKGDLRQDTPSEVKDALRRLIEDDASPAEWPAHPFFSNVRRDQIAHGGSAYFVTGSSEYIDTTYGYPKFFITSSLKDYTDTIGEFLDWLLPYVDAFPGDFLGYTRYEEDDRPTLIVMPDLRSGTARPLGDYIDGEVIPEMPSLVSGDRHSDGP